MVGIHLFVLIRMAPEMISIEEPRISLNPKAEKCRCQIIVKAENPFIPPL